MIDSLEFIRGIIISSGAFVIVAGIFLTFSNSRKYFKKWSLALVLISLVLGVVVIITSLFWFHEPTYVRVNSALWLLIAQFIIFCIPVLTVIISYYGND